MPAELAEAAVLGDLALVLEVLGWFLPTIGAIFQGLAVVPFAALAARRRARAAVMATLAAASVAFLIGGVGIVLETAIGGTLGLSVGVAFRRGWRPLSAVGLAFLVAGLPVALLSLAAEALSPGLRRLAFAQVRIVERSAVATWHGLRSPLLSLGLAGPVRAGDGAVTSMTAIVNWAIAHWWLTVPLLEVLLVVLAAGICARYLRPLLERLERDIPTGEQGPSPGAARSRANRDKLDSTQPEVAPVPVVVERVSYQYAGTFAWAVAEVSVRVDPGALVAIVGENGSGKSTLVRLVAGRLEPTIGTVSRPGEAGLGEVGGTAMVFQRPESQVLGVRVIDDLVWGLAPAVDVDVEGLLAKVGLSGFELRETSVLSGGELQRLAIAAALVRQPRLFISDESTAMIDAKGRHDVVELLESLVAHSIAVVHVTHRLAEASHATEIVELSGGRVVPRPSNTQRGAITGEATTLRESASLESHRTRPLAVAARGRPRELVCLRGVGYVYASRTPWAHRALEGVDLSIGAGEGVVVTGANGSGKSTLAWVLAGLAEPTEGEALLEGDPIRTGTGRVGIAFQHSRLQLLRPTVRADVAYGADGDRADAALASVGLDPGEFGSRPVDALSGGEQRRVALAGLLVREPELIVLDEPFAGLDTGARLGLASLLATLRREREVAIVVVSHDLEDAGMLGERLVVLERGRIDHESMLAGPS